MDYVFLYAGNTSGVAVMGKTPLVTFKPKYYNELIDNKKPDRPAKGKRNAWARGETLN
jgi:hypothetical protein